MYPQTFLNTFWRMELRPVVFVAMSFDEKYDDRFRRVIMPAIQSLSIDGKYLAPLRVDTTKSGESILTQITDGIAHSQLFLADVSTIGKDSASGRPFRNANVLYEVGLALACRHPSEVLLIRDDHDPFLFDVSTVPHETIDFVTDRAAAIVTLRTALAGRLKEQSFERDARVSLAIDQLTAEEVVLLKRMKNAHDKFAWGDPVSIHS